jgi:hypothetical protein
MRIIPMIEPHSPPGRSGHLHVALGGQDEAVLLAPRMERLSPVLQKKLLQKLM